MRTWFTENVVGWPGSAGLLVLRLAMGAAFVLHGWPKFQNPLGWMPPNMAVPALFQGLAALAEFGGGIALIVGFLTRLAALGIACNMVVALAMVHLPLGHSFVGKPGTSSFELAAIYLACSILLLLQGAGKLALDALVHKRVGRLCHRQPPEDTTTPATPRA